MRDQPSADQLLVAARDVLSEDLLPALPPEKRHAALMVANALSIAARQLGHEETADRAELAALAQLLGEPGWQETEGAAALYRALVAANRELAQWIRAGRADGGALRERLHAHLVAVARDKLAESNPKYLGKV